MTGWKCPGCGACFAPTTTECRHCAPERVEGPSAPVYVCAAHVFDTAGRCRRCGFRATPTVTSSATYRPSLGVELAGHVTPDAT